LYPNASVVLAGDFNKLNIAEVSARTGLQPQVKTPTRGEKVLDMLMTSAPNSYLIKVTTSAVRSDVKGSSVYHPGDQTPTWLKPTTKLTQAPE